MSLVNKYSCILNAKIHLRGQKQRRNSTFTPSQPRRIARAENDSKTVYFIFRGLPKLHQSLVTMSKVSYYNIHTHLHETKQGIGRTRFWTCVYLFSLHEFDTQRIKTFRKDESEQNKTKQTNKQKRKGKK